MNKLAVGSSIAEYDLAPNSAYLFGVGELWAALHARNIELRLLQFGDFALGPAGVPTVSTQARLQQGEVQSPGAAAHDLMQALSCYPADDAQALLAGYVRGGYELLDPLRACRFTDALLEHLEVSGPALQPGVEELEVNRLLDDLAVEVAISNGCLTLTSKGVGGKEVWAHCPRQAFQLILALLVAGVDCRPLFKRDGASSSGEAVHPLYDLLCSQSQPPAELESEMQRLADVAPGLELAIGLCSVLRRQGLTEPFEFNDVLYWVRYVLQAGEQRQATRLGDVLVHVILRCTEWAILNDPQPSFAESFAQKAAILIEHTCRGERSDEQRLSALNTCFRSLPRYPAALLCETFVPHVATLPIAVWNSLLLAYRALAQKSVDHQEHGSRGALRSAALRGVYTARHVLPLCLTAAFSAEPETAMQGYLVLRVTVKNYAMLLFSLWRSAAHELKTAGGSSWGSYFVQEPRPSHLAREMEWISGFLEATAQEGFSRDAARTWVNRGAEFLPGLDAALSKLASS